MARLSDFVKAEIKKVPEETAGIYLLMDTKGEVIYVGQSSNLKNRLKDHFRGYSNIKHWSYMIDSFSYIEEGSGSQSMRTKLEGNYINKYMPILNSEVRQTAKFMDYMDKVDEKRKKLLFTDVELENVRNFFIQGEISLQEYNSFKNQKCKEYGVPFVEIAEHYYTELYKRIEKLDKQIMGEAVTA